MGKQLHNRMCTEEVKKVFARYEAGELTGSMGQRLLGVKRRQWYDLLKRYRRDPSGFTVGYERHQANRQLSAEVDELIISELKKEKALLQSRDNPIKFYNYSYVQTRLEELYGVEVSLSTIIRRAKKTVIT